MVLALIAAVMALASVCSIDQVTAVTPTPAAANLSTPVHAYDPPTSSTTPAANTRTDPARSNRSMLNGPRSSTSLAGLRHATKVADDAADVGTDLAVRPKLKPSRHYLHERKMERQLRTADVFDAYKNPLAVGPTRYDPFGRPSTLFQGRNAQVAVNPQTGEIVTAFPTGSRLRRQLFRRAGGSP